VVRRPTEIRAPQCSFNRRGPIGAGRSSILVDGLPMIADAHYFEETVPSGASIVIVTGRLEAAHVLVPGRATVLPEFIGTFSAAWSVLLKVYRQAAGN